MIEYISKNPRSARTKRIYLKMLADVEDLKKEALHKLK
jgi:hypothetical protein